jgi:hypothetical protein
MRHISYVTKHPRPQDIFWWTGPSHGHHGMRCFLGSNLWHDLRQSEKSSLAGGHLPSTPTLGSLRKAGPSHRHHGMRCFLGSNLWHDLRQSEKSSLAGDHLPPTPTLGSLRKGLSLLIKLPACWIRKRQNTAVFNRESPCIASLYHIQADAVWATTGAVRLQTSPTAGALRGETCIVVISS